MSTTTTHENENEPRTRVLLLGCGKTKAASERPARDLYTGPLFTARRKYADRQRQAWGIMSAKYGFLEPAELVEPYETKLKDLSSGQRIELGNVTVGDFANALRGYRCIPGNEGIEIEAHVGLDYLEALNAIDWREEGIWIVRAPVVGMAIGEQLHWYAANTPPAPAPSTYRGWHNPQGGEAFWFRVTRDDREFHATRSIAIRYHSPTGFAWGYGGSGPTQLALAILLEETDMFTAIEFYPQFTRQVIAKFAESGFTLTSSEVEQWLGANARKERP